MKREKGYKRSSSILPGFSYKISPRLEDSILLFRLSSNLDSVKLRFAFAMLRSSTISGIHLEIVLLLFFFFFLNISAS
jgi:hypothetical protein